MGTRPRKRLSVEAKIPMRTVDTKEDNQMIKKLMNRGSNDVNGYSCRLATETHLMWAEALWRGMVSEGG